MLLLREITDMFWTVQKFCKLLKKIFKKELIMQELIIPSLTWWWFRYKSILQFLASFSDHDWIQGFNGYGKKTDFYLQNLD